MTIADPDGTFESTYANTIAAAAVEVQAGDTVVVLVGGRRADVNTLTVTAVGDGGSNTGFTIVNDVSTAVGNYAYGAIAVKHNCSANASAVFTASLSDTWGNRSIKVLVLRPASGYTLATEAAATFTDGSSTSLASPALSVSAAALVIAFGKTYGAVDFSLEAVDAVAADAYKRLSQVSDSWYRALSGADASVSSAATASISSNWVCGSIAVREVSSGTIVPALMHHLQEQGAL